LSAAGLFERESELEQLTRSLDGVGLEGGKVVLVRGEAGIGKTALVREFLDRSSEAAHVLSGSCDDLLTARPLGPFRDMSRAEPSLIEPLGAGDATRVMDSVLDLVSRRMRPTVLVVEDTHWADEATLDVIQVVGRRIKDTNGLIVLTYRDGEVDLDHPLRSVMGVLPGEAVLSIRLTGLSLESVSLLAGDSDVDPSQVLAMTGGNPFLAIEMISGFGQADSESVKDAVIARVRRMSLEAQEALTLLSVVPERISVLEAQRVIGQAGESLVECEKWGLLETHDGLVGFRHELVRHAVEASLRGSERADANRRVLESLQGDMDPTRQAHHARQAGDVDRLLEYAPLAAEAARAVNSHREAVGHYHSLGPHMDRLDASRRARIFEDWAQSELLLENQPEAISKLTKALDTYRTLGDDRALGRCLARAVRLHELAKQPAEADKCLAEAITVLEPLGETAELAFAVSQEAWLYMMRGDFDQAAPVADRAIRFAERTGNLAAMVNALNTKGSISYRPGDSAGRSALEEASRIARELKDANEEVRALHNLAYTAMNVRDLGFARDTAMRTLDAAAKYKLPNLEKTAQMDFGRILLLQGDWSAAETLASEALDTTPDKSSAAAWEFYWLLGTIQVRKGFSDARANLARSWSVMEKSEEKIHMVVCAVSLAEYMWLTGDIDPEMISDFLELMDEVVALGDPWQSGELALWMWKLGELAEPHNQIAEPYRLVIDGDPIAAASIWHQLGYPYERAIALSHGDTNAQLEALEALNQLGATAVADKLRQELRATGVSVPPVNKGPEPRGGLTARQSEVLALLAERLSNLEIADRLFLSPRTVENHVAAVMTKLGARTRNEAVAIAEKRGLFVAS
jgi:DNA-binding CsgD family transcriptional regulator/tetratricopeptide (TPR) repeat protein